jgi:ADP-heptose:LPS heptosyltransferase
MALPAVERLVAANAGGETCLHTRPPARGLLELLYPGVRIVASPPKALPWAAAIRVCRGSGRHSVGVTLRHADRAKLLLRLASRRSFGSAEGIAAVVLSRRCPVDRTRHQVHDADALLGALGIPPVDPRWCPPMADASRRDGARALSAVGCPLGAGPLVGLAPGATGGPAKRWPPEAFGALARRLVARSLVPVVVAGPGEETLIADVRHAANAALPAVGPALDVAGLYRVLASMRVVVGNDSGPLHLARLAGSRVVGLFGPTDPGRTAPEGEGVRVLHNRLECTPCGETSCALSHHRCLRELTVERVEEAVMELVQAVA